jgi:dienelactone hydrolase
MKSFIQILLVAFIFTACSSAEEQQAAEGQANIVGEELSYASDDLTMNGYLAYDESMEGARPGILVVHEWWGHDDYARSRADSLAKLGYVALAVDMYGEGKQAAHPEDAQKFSSQVMSNFESARDRFQSALDTLKTHPSVNSEQIGAVGYCFGGSVAIAMANAGVDLDGVAAFHAGLQLPVMPEEGTTTSRIIVMNGADDPFITEEQEQNLSAAMDSAGVDYNYITYEGVKHSFTNPEATARGEEFGLPLVYDAEADQQSWATMKEFFDETFTGE